MLSNLLGQMCNPLDELWCRETRDVDDSSADAGEVGLMSVLALTDVVGVYNLADFMIRPDGSQQEPDNMLPQEKIMVTMIAFPFLTIVIAFAFAPRKNAALIAAATHGLYTLHQLVHCDTWRALFHSDTQLTMEFFIYTKEMWLMVSMIIWYLESKAEAQNARQKTSQKTS
ncbi:unnamed protein product [Cylindrotheca closterium]|uniref:Uncharacterized protein n=1 Tax=Cylindrotheca closterium TaxID=2856 RepID=A0AAD2CBP9_9STRA|nr:unnamed protein product [Cylindrotheca closterium]